MTILNIEVELYLSSIHDFRRYYMPLYNKDRLVSGLPIVDDEDTINNLFLDLRAKHLNNNVRNKRTDTSD